MSLMNNNDRQAELDAVRQKIADAVKANDAAAFSSALTEYGQLIETSILAEAEKSADAKIQAATQHIDSEVLRSRGVRFVGPESGRVACGADGEGRLAGIENILTAVREILG